MFIVQLVGITILCAMATMAVVVFVISAIVMIGDWWNGHRNDD